MKTYSPAVSKQYLAEMQAKLSTWSAADPTKLFDDIFNILRDERTIRAAYCEVIKSKSADVPGPDGQTCRTIRGSIGDEGFVKQLADDLKCHRYLPGPCKTFEVEHGGKKRLVYVGNIRDRTVGYAIRSVLEPTIHPRLHPGSSAYIKGRGTHYALQLLKALALDPSVGCVLEIDISNYYASVVISRLIVELRKHVTDRHVIRLVEGLLTSGSTGVLGSNPIGILPGAPASTVFANLYRHPLDLFIAGHPSVVDLVAYGDDLRIGIRGGREEAVAVLGDVMNFAQEELQLTLAPGKTEIVMPDHQMNFLSCSVDWGAGKFIVRPSPKAIARLKTKVQAAVIASENNKDDVNYNGDQKVDQIARGFQDYFSRFAPRADIERFTSAALKDSEGSG